MKKARDERTPKDQRTDANSIGAPDGALVAPASSSLGEGAAFARRYLARSAEVLMYWMPVWVPLILLAQFSTRGLSPALLEEQRLMGQTQILDERLEADELRSHELDLKLEALDDEIYHERLLRLHRDDARAEIERRGLAPVISVSAEPASDRP